MSDKEPGWIIATRVLVAALVAVFFVGTDYLLLFGEETSPFALLLLLPVLGIIYWMLHDRSGDTNPDDPDNISPAKRVDRLFDTSGSRSGKGHAD